MSILAIDPAPAQSAYVVLDGPRLLEHGIMPNVEFRQLLALRAMDPIITACVIEMIASYGRPVGAEVFETCVWIGRFCEVWRKFHATDPTLVPRLAVKLAICHDGRAKDPHVRQALIDRFGGPASIRKGGPLYRVKADEWAALGLAVTYQELDHE